MDIESNDAGGDQDFNDLIAVVRADIDSDGDGLWDDWERFGADTDGDNVVDLDLPGLGADPNRKDVFVEIDWMDCAVAGGDCVAGDNHNHRPKAAAVTAAINAFGAMGINLHVELNNAIAHQQALNIARYTDGVTSVDDHLAVTSAQASSGTTSTSGSNAVATTGSSITK